MGKTIGIDLGTTNSVAAVSENGRVRVLSTGYAERLTPSVVSYQAARRNAHGDLIEGRILVGRPALNNFVSAPKDTIFSIKRLIGRPINDGIVQKMIDSRHFTYSILSNQDNAAEDYDIYVMLNGERYTPVDISAMILRQVKEDAERILGEPVTHAVITAPNYFGDRQRRATFAAGVQAGLIVKQILTEPTAAAISFGVDFQDERNYILVFDMGGGTTDVSVVQSVNARFKVLGMAGDMWLGGDDFDQALIEMIIAYIERNHDYSPRQNPYFMSLAKRAAEDAKKALSTLEIADINIPNAIIDPPISVSFSVTRSEFEDAIKTHLRRAEDLVTVALSESGIAPDRVTNVLLVGGSTFVPAVQQILAQKFGRERLRVHQDPSEAVAYGAALVAATLEAVVCPNCDAENPVDAEFCQTCGSSLRGVDAPPRQAQGSGFSRIEPLPNTISIGVKQGNRLDGISPIARKGTPYPLKEPLRRSFRTTQGTSLVMPIYEGESSKASENELQALIEVRFPSLVKAGAEAVVLLNIDENRLLTVSVEIESQNVNTGFIEIRSNVSAAGKHISQYVDLRQVVENLLTVGQSFLDNYGDFLELDRRGTRAKIEVDIKRARQALQDRDEKAMERIYHVLDRSIQNSGIASSLFIADIIILQVAYNSEVERIRRTIDEIKSALREGDREKVQMLKTPIDTFNSRYADAIIGNISPYGGVLEEE